MLFFFFVRQNEEEEEKEVSRIFRNWMNHWMEKMQLNAVYPFSLCTTYSYLFENDFRLLLTLTAETTNSIDIFVLRSISTNVYVWCGKHFEGVQQMVQKCTNSWILQFLIRWRSVLGVSVFIFSVRILRILRAFIVNAAVSFENCLNGFACIVSEIMNSWQIFAKMVELQL